MKRAIGHLKFFFGLGMITLATGCSGLNQLQIAQPIASTPVVAQMPSPQPNELPPPEASVEREPETDEEQGSVTITAVDEPEEPVAQSGPCPEGMVHVEGEFCPRVSQRCLEWHPHSWRCLRFEQPTHCASRHRQHLDFCMDRYEWPNREGEFPAVLTTWEEASRMCRSQHKRLCGEDEWTLACEGPEMLPYPYGYERDPQACNIDHSARSPNRRLLASPQRSVARAEAARVYQALRSGEAARCVSPYGVHDMTGNVDEWAVSRTGAPYRSVLKGGWWGRVRTRCRVHVDSHNEIFRYYNIGFRCCANTPTTRDSPLSSR